ncbi:DUF3618 domain-containing protein [Sphingomonas sp. 1P06PA]|uniref:DUF3618 domain-containing protein n=1 Tax=Sphingomonas sp. 1P06PA TaxID=554121 RepID=UPI0039A64CCB
MSRATAKLRAAQVEAATARAGMAEALAALQTRLDPRNIARSAIETVRERGEEFADDAVDLVRRRPVAAGAAAAAAVALVVQKPLRRGFAAMIDRLTRKTPEPLATPSVLEGYNDETGVRGPDPLFAAPEKEI